VFVASLRGPVVRVRTFGQAGKDRPIGEYGFNTGGLVGTAASTSDTCSFGPAPKPTLTPETRAPLDEFGRVDGADI
jgi:hypothetical protein